MKRLTNDEANVYIGVNGMNFEESFFSEVSLESYGYTVTTYEIHSFDETNKFMTSKNVTNEIKVKPQHDDLFDALCEEQCGYEQEYTDYILHDSLEDAMKYLQTKEVMSYQEFLKAYKF